jgi:hypothetical protein
LTNKRTFTKGDKSAFHRIEADDPDRLLGGIPPLGRARLAVEAANRLKSCSMVPAQGVPARVTDVKRIIVGLILIGVVSILSGCANVIDVLCPPSGQCPNVSPGHGGGY